LYFLHGEFKPRTDSATDVATAFAQIRRDHSIVLVATLAEADTMRSVAITADGPGAVHSGRVQQLSPASLTAETKP
jgi:hypothetical protein